MKKYLILSLLMATSLVCANERYFEEEIINRAMLEEVEKKLSNLKEDLENLKNGQEHILFHLKNIEENLFFGLDPVMHNN